MSDQTLEERLLEQLDSAKRNGVENLGPLYSIADEVKTQTDLLRDRIADLEFEYGLRVKGEASVEKLKEYAKGEKRRTLEAIREQTELADGLIKRAEATIAKLEGVLQALEITRRDVDGMDVISVGNRQFCGNDPDFPTSEGYVEVAAWLDAEERPQSPGGYR